MRATSVNAKCKMPNANAAGFDAAVESGRVRPLRFRHVAFAFCILHFAFGLTACSRGEDDKAAPAVAAPATVQVGAENVVVVKRDAIVSGPIISGALQPAREATIRAELGGSVTEVSVEAGQAVRVGTLLGRIDTKTLDDTRLSAASAVRSAENQLAVARRELERAETLVNAGAVAAREVDVAKNNVSAAEAQVADANSRLMSVTNQLNDAVIRSPINGVVSRRAVNHGDIVTVGSELFVVIDPSSMRLEASVPSESLSELKVGATVSFEVRGYAQPFEGHVERISPQADPTTRQVPIYVAIPNAGGRLVAGLYAEGRVVSQSAEGLVVPSNAVNTTGKPAWALRVNNGKTEKVDVTLGLRDPRTERVQVVSGLAEGDTVLRGASQGITPGTPVSVNVSQ